MSNSNPPGRHRADRTEKPDPPKLRAGKQPRKTQAYTPEVVDEGVSVPRTAAGTPVYQATDNARYTEQARLAEERARRRGF